VSFPDYDVLFEESNPDIAGSAVRLALLRRGAGLEREQILEVLTNWTVEGVGDYPDGYRDALAAVIRVINGELK
jgi:hypothetical protein